MVTRDQLASRVFTGKVLASGLAQGLTYAHQGLPSLLEIPERLSRSEIDDELSRLDIAMEGVSVDLVALATRLEKQVDPKLAEVFAAHELMLNDRMLKEELQKEIVQNLVNASSAVKTVFLRWERRFLLMESQMARDKSDDMHDISVRLRNALSGITVHSLDKAPNGCILVTQRLLPSDTAFLSARTIGAVLLQVGSFGSHAALFAREMGLPTISGFPSLFDIVPDNIWVLVDADDGTVTTNPTIAHRTSFDKKVRTKKAAVDALRRDARRPAVTRDGVRIEVQANIGSRRDALNAMNNGADGIGLYRIEQVYLGRVVPPDKEELVHEMRNTLEPAANHPICIRLLDAGADKPLPFLGFPAEPNPAMGLRGIRLLLKYPELLKTQFFAVLELSREFDIRVLIPMVTLADDLVLVKSLLQKTGADLKLSSLPLLGAMIETPSAVISAKNIAKYVDFFSFGTNDLAQYTFAADRDNPAVEHYLDNDPEILFKLLEMTRKDVPGMPLSLCGELGGRPEYIGRLVDLGIRTFSVAAPLVADVKKAIRSHQTHSHR